MNASTVCSNGEGCEHLAARTSESTSIIPLDLLDLGIFAWERALHNFTANAGMLGGYECDMPQPSGRYHWAVCVQIPAGHVGINQLQVRGRCSRPPRGKLCKRGHSLDNKQCGNCKGKNAIKAGPTSPSQAATNVRNSRHTEQRAPLEHLHSK